MDEDTNQEAVESAVGSLAPTYSIPDRAVLAIEHPCLVKNNEAAISTLGGPKAISQMLTVNNTKTIGLKFEPENPYCRPVLSSNVPTSNILLKVTLPRRTGRKRKRGSDDPFTETTTPEPPHKDVSYLLQSLEDNRGEIDVEPLGKIASTHMWRSMPDLVYSTHGSKFLSTIRSEMLSEDFARMKGWTLPRTYGLTDPEVIPPPVLSSHHLPFNYSYRQNPAVKTILNPETGQMSLHNTQKPLRIYSIQVQHDTPEYPVEPATNCPPLADQPESLQKLVQEIQALFEVRPIWTRRALINNLAEDSQFYLARSAIGYVAFAIRSGPWRDALCKFGTDPRSSADYRKHQTIMLQLLPRDRKDSEKKGAPQRTWIRSQDRSSHIFRGQDKISPDGKVWQLCDLEDEQLKSLVDVPDLLLRSVCESRYFGWYPNGVMAKLRVVLRAKIDGIIEGAPLDDSALVNVMALPDEWDGVVRTGPELEYMDAAAAGYAPKGASNRDLEWASAYRSICRAMPGATPSWGGAGKGRANKKKPDARPSYLGQDSPTQDREDTSMEADAEEQVDVEAEAEIELDVGDGGEEDESEEDM